MFNVVSDFGPHCIYKCGVCLCVCVGVCVCVCVCGVCVCVCVVCGVCVCGERETNLEKERKSKKKQTNKQSMKCLSIDDGCNKTMSYFWPLSLAVSYTDVESLI